MDQAAGGAYDPARDEVIAQIEAAKVSIQALIELEMYPKVEQKNVRKK